MQANMKDGSVIVAGTCGRDAELKLVGDKQSRMCKVSLAVGKRPSADGGKEETIWCNLQAWHNLASILSVAKKGDSIFATGRIKENQSNGKTYKNLEAEFLSVASLQCAADSPAFPLPPVDQFAELMEDDGELPF